MSSLSGHMNIARVSIEFFTGCKKIKQRRISFVLGYLRMILWKIPTAVSIKHWIFATFNKKKIFNSDSLYAFNQNSLDILYCLWFIIICTLRCNKINKINKTKQLTTHFPETGTPFSKWTLQDYQNIKLIDYLSNAKWELFHLHCTLITNTSYRQQPL